MRRCHWLPITSCGLALCLLSGCLRGTIPDSTRGTLTGNPLDQPEPEDVPPAEPSAEGRPRSDYQVCQPVSAPQTPQTASAAPLVKPIEMRIPSEPPPPAQPSEPPTPEMRLRPPPPAKPEAPLVVALREVLEQQPADDALEEHLKHHDAETRKLLVSMLRSAARLEKGDVDQASARDVTRLVDQLNALTVSLRSRALLALDKMCFCSRIENFGQFKPLPHDCCFQPGEEASVYLQVRNFSSRPSNGGYETILKGKMEIYEEHNQRKPVYYRDFAPKVDYSLSLRQDYFVNILFPIPSTCPPGSYTLWVQIEDVTPLPGRQKETRSARRSLDFHVGNAVYKQPASNDDRGPAR
jgi:hypothetical protein